FQWDLRTFHLLHTVPALDQCRVVFNSNGTIVYGGMGLTLLPFAKSDEFRCAVHYMSWLLSLLMNSDAAS
ncbi:hypothetical protein GOODEAATRI_002706, partial [Goodea atripinnis]